VSLTATQVRILYPPQKFSKKDTISLASGYYIKIAVILGNMKEEPKKYSGIGRRLALLTLFGLFVFKGIIFTDPDFWWRLRDGELFLNIGVIKFDPYSYTMPIFPFVDHAYLQSIVFWLGYQIGGKFLLSFLYSAIAVSSLLLSVSLIGKKERDFLSDTFHKSLKVNAGNLGNIIFLAGAFLMFSFFGIRVQVMSWFLLSVFLHILFKDKLFRKYSGFLPAYFFLWANIHGSFLLGLTIMLIVFAVKIIKRKANTTYLVSLVLLSALSTLINPYGIGIWSEVLSSVADSRIRFAVIEWMPSVFYPNFNMIILISLTAVFVFRYFRRFRLSEILVFIYLLLQSLMSRRHLPLWVITAIPLIGKGLYFFYSNELKDRVSQKRFALAYKYFFVFSAFIIFAQAFLELKGAASYREGDFYPQNAVSYITENGIPGRIFSDYGWGGYLIYKIPDNKVFIDGRMPSWKLSPNEKIFPESAYTEYTKIVSGRSDFEKEFEKYGISMVLWPARQKKGTLTKITEIFSGILKNQNFTKEKPDFLKSLEDASWCKFYKDKTAVVMLHPQSCQELGKN
jgi:hypothetical protein